MVQWTKKNKKLPFAITKDILNKFEYSQSPIPVSHIAKKISAEEHKNLYQETIDIFNKSINKTRIIVDMIDRFIIRGRNSYYDLDALICGTTDDYVWITKYDIYDLVLSKRCLDYTSPHIACMTIGPKKRNLDGNSKNNRDRYLVCIRWNYIKQDIIDFKNKKREGDE